MKIVLASRNKHKIGELQALLSESIKDLEILSLDDVGIFSDIVEDGESFEENALIKARAAASSGYIGIGDDSGLCVDALGGAPGIYSARYSSEHASADENNKLLLKNLKGETLRDAKFVCVMACVFPEGRESFFCVRGEAYGRILEEYAGDGGFGYDPLFYSTELKKTYAQMSPDEKNLISHRGRAVKLLAEKLSAYGEN